MGRSIKTARSIDLITNLANAGKAVAAEQDNAESMMSTLLSDTAKELLERQRKNELHYGKELKCEVTIDCDSTDYIQNLIRRLLEEYMEIRSTAENPELNGDGANKGALMSEADDFYYAAYALSIYSTFVDE